MVVVEERDIFCFFTPAPPCSNRVLGNPREDGRVKIPRDCV